MATLLQCLVMTSQNATSGKCDYVCLLSMFGNLKLTLYFKFNVFSQINHAVKLDVDEKGVEGAAATAIQISFRSGFEPTRIDVVRPFYFSITNRCWSDKVTVVY